MTAKEYLQQYMDATRQISAYAEQIMRLEAQATKITQVLSQDKVQSSTGDKLSGIVAKIADMETELQAEVDWQLEAQVRVVEAIKMVPSAPQRQVLMRRYLNGMKWEQIAVDLHYTYRHVTRLHGEALKTLTFIRCGRKMEEKV